MEDMLQKLREMLTRNEASLERESNQDSYNSAWLNGSIYTLNQIIAEIELLSSTNP